MGQIKVGDETDINLPISTGISSEEIFHNELIKNAHTLLEKTNCFFPMKQTDLPSDLPKDIDSSFFNSLIKSIYGVDQINNERLNLGQRLLSIAEIGEVKLLVNIGKIISKFDEKNLKQKINRQNILNLISNFNKENNDDDIKIS